MSRNKAVYPTCLYRFCGPKLLFWLALIYGFNIFGQVTIKKGTSFTVLNNTKVEFRATNDTFLIEDSTRVINNGEIVLNQGVILHEKPLYPIKGIGMEISNNTFTSSVSNENIGGLGFIISTSVAPGNVLLKRARTTILSGVSQVERWFQYQQQNPSQNIIEFKYDSTEINGIDQNVLNLMNSDTLNSNWLTLGGVSEPENFKVVYNGTDSTGYFTLAPFYIDEIQLNKDTLCNGDLLEISFSIKGIANSGNECVLEVSDEFGNFSPGNPIDTTQTTTNGIFSSALPSFITSGNYSLRIRTTEIPDTFMIGQIFIRANPVVSFSGIDTAYCTNDSQILLSPSPAGGTFSGAGIIGVNEFHPQVAQPGTHTIVYNYQDQWGCNGIVQKNVTIHPVPAIPVISQVNNILSSDIGGNIQWLLNGDTIPGATSQNFETFTSGLYSVIITNSFGCSSVSDSYNLDLTTIKSNYSDVNASAKIYPNPARDQFTISLNNIKEETKLLIFNIHGQELLEEYFHPNKETIKEIRIIDLPAGKYVLFIISASYFETKSIIKL